MVVCCCFPSSTTVTTKSRGVVNINELLPSDKVLTLGSSGKGLWSRFYSYVHFEDDLAEDFLHFRLSNEKAFDVSREHLIYIYNPSNGARVVRRAGQVQKGEQLIYCEGSDGVGIENPIVEEISMQRSLGVYAPLTMSGHFLANGVLTTCYGHVDNMTLAQLAFGPLRTWHTVKTSLSSTSSRKWEQNGVHPYAKALMKFRKNVPLIEQLL